STRDLPVGSRTSKPFTVPPTPDDDPEAEAKRVVSEPVASGQRLLANALPRRDQTLRPSPNVISRGGVHRADTVMMPTAQAQQMLEAASREIEATTEQYMPKTVDPAQPGIIHGRYLRGGRWIPTRIGALSLKGASLMAGALPRVDDRVDVSLSFEKHRALVRGAVAKVSSMQEAQATGATTFSVNFELDDASRRELTALLTAARAAKVTIKPPPARSTRRYPVEWPMTFGTMRGAVRAEALDVSTEGMFVRPLNDLALDANLTFTSVLDDGGPPVSGRARAVRRVGEVEARGAGLSPGYGLMILEMTEAERERWCGFLGRIEKRASKRVLIGAA
ncbi:MAG: PilZ domain-containing protein, partial [Solirubrobacteraceae bacterium]